MRSFSPRRLLRFSRFNSMMLIVAFATALSRAEAIAGEAGRSEPARPVLITRFKAPSGFTLSFSRDGKRLLTGDQTTIQVWDIEKLALTEPLELPHRIRVASISPDGSVTMCAAGPDVVLRIIKNGSMITLHHASTVMSASFSPDGSMIVTAALDDKIVRLWKTESGEEVMRLENPNAAHFASFSPQGDRVLSLSDAKIKINQSTGDAIIWDAATGRKLVQRHIDDPPITWKPGWVRSAVFSRNGKMIASHVFRLIIVWDASTGDVIFSEDMLDVGQGTLQLDFRPDNSLLVTADQDFAHVWSIADKELVMRIPGDHSMIVDAQFSPSGRYLLTTGSADANGVWDIKTKKQVLSMKKSEGRNMPTAAWSPRASLVAFGDANSGVTTIWSIKEGQGN